MAKKSIPPQLLRAVESLLQQGTGASVAEALAKVSKAIDAYGSPQILLDLLARATEANEALAGQAIDQGSTASASQEFEATEVEVASDSGESAGFIEELQTTAGAERPGKGKEGAWPRGGVRARRGGALRGVALRNLARPASVRPRQGDAVEVLRAQEDGENGTETAKAAGVREEPRPAFSGCRLEWGSPRYENGAIAVPLSLRKPQGTAVKVISIQLERHGVSEATDFEVRAHGGDGETLDAELSGDLISLGDLRLPWSRLLPNTLFAEVRLDVGGSREGHWAWIKVNRRRARWLRGHSGAAVSEVDRDEGVWGANVGDSQDPEPRR